MKRSTLFAAMLVVACGAKPEKSTPKPEPKPEVKPVASAPVEPATKKVEPAANATPTPEFKKDKAVLFDVRAANLTKPQIAPDEQEKVLAKLFTKRLKKIDECTKPEPGSKTSEEDIASGQIAPSVLLSLTGAFTAPNTTQSLYLINVGECNAEVTRDTPETSTLWAIIEKDELVVKSPGSFFDYLRAIDIDQNGTLDVLGINEGEEMGAIFTSIGLFTVNGKDISAVKEIEYKDVRTNTCPSKEMGVDTNDLFHKITIVSYTPTEPGKLPTFSEEKLKADCPKDGKSFEFKPSAD